MQQPRSSHEAWRWNPSYRSDILQALDKKDFQLHQCCALNTSYILDCKEQCKHVHETINHEPPRNEGSWRVQLFPLLELHFRTHRNQTSTLVTNTNCSYVSNSGQECIASDPSAACYGPGFTGVGGGVFVIEMVSTGTRHDYHLIYVRLHQLMLCWIRRLAYGSFQPVYYANDKTILPSAELAF